MILKVILSHLFALLHCMHRFQNMVFTLVTTQFHLKHFLLPFVFDLIFLSVHNVGLSMSMQTFRFSFLVKTTLFSLPSFSQQQVWHYLFSVIPQIIICTIKVVSLKYNTTEMYYLPDDISGICFYIKFLFFLFLWQWLL